MAASQSTVFATLSFHKTDCIRLLQFPDDIYTNMQTFIPTSWPPGITSRRRFGERSNSYEFKLKGRPFGWSNDQDAIGGARLVRDLLAFIYHSNWELMMPLGCAVRLSAKDILIFRPRPPGADPRPAMDWLAVAPMGVDKLYFIGDAQPTFDGARSLTDHTPDHVDWLVISVSRLLTEMGLLQSSDTRYNWVEFKFKGRPWSSGGVDGVNTRVVLLRIMEVLDRFGWASCTSVQHRTGNDDRRMLDTMLFMRPKSLVMDTPPTSPPPPSPQPPLSELPPYSATK
ncbi:hypothetical protein OQA88_7525 [Cercophora sp. LCS_1]